MSISREDIREALGLGRRGDWLVPGLFGLGLGALLGASVALLLTPRSGADLRSALGERARRIVRSGGERVREMAEELSSPEHDS